MTSAIAMLARHEKGKPLHTLHLGGDGLKLLLEYLAPHTRRGILGLADTTTARVFVVVAAEIVATELTTLAWSPLLERVGVPKHDHGEYPTLYPHVQRALESFGRRMLLAHGRRRFLGTLLREGGLPVKIGHLAELVQQAVRETGWSALAGPQREHARSMAALRMRFGAHGLARRLLDQDESRRAVEELLRDAADVREDLIAAGVDPATLTTPEEVERQLERHGITGLSLRNEQLLRDILSTFDVADRAEVDSPQVRQELASYALRIDAAGRPTPVVLVEVEHPALHETIPASTTHVRLSVEPDASTHATQSVGVSRASRTRFGATSGEKTVQFEMRGLATSARSVIARYIDNDGARSVVPVAQLGGLVEQPRWFGADGYQLAAAPARLSAHEDVWLATSDEAEVDATGGVAVETAAVALRGVVVRHVCVSGPGSLELRDRGEQLTIDGGLAFVDVRVVQAAPVRFASSDSTVGDLPDLILPEGCPPLSLAARIGNEPEYRVVEQALTGRVRLSRVRALRDLVGTLRLQLRGDDGAVWAGKWWVMPRSVQVTREPGKIVIDAPTGAEVASEGRLAHERDGQQWTFHTASDADVERFRLTLESGDSAGLSIPVLATSVRLRNAEGETQPWHPTPVMTEVDANHGAVIEVRGLPLTPVHLATPGGETILRWSTDRNGRALVPLLEVVRWAVQHWESQLRVQVSAPGVPGNHTFTIAVPRIKPPKLCSDRDDLTMKVALDAADLPDAPGMALFDTRQPLAPAHVVDAQLVPVSDGQEVVLEAAAIDGLHGAFITFVVDRAQEPPRPMSGGKLVRLPWGAEPVPPSERASDLEMALWSGERARIADALRDAIRNADVLGGLLAGVPSAASNLVPYGLRWFNFFDVINREACWILLAAAQRLDGSQRASWLDNIVDAIDGFSWLRIRRRDAAGLGTVLAELAPEVRMGVIALAKQVRSMPEAIELLLLDELFTTPAEQVMVRAVRASAYGVGVRALLEEWRTIALPRDPELIRWINGAPEDPEVDELIDTIERTQLAKGARIHALRELSLAVVHAPNAFASVAPNLRMRDLDLPWLLPVRARLDQEWRGRDQGCVLGPVAELERACLEAAALLTEYREGGRHVGWEWDEILKLEALAPRLLDVWLLALAVARPSEESR